MWRRPLPPTFCRQPPAPRAVSPQPPRAPIQLGVPRQASRNVCACCCVAASATRAVSEMRSLAVGGSIGASAMLGDACSVWIGRITFNRSPAPVFAMALRLNTVLVAAGGSEFPVSRTMCGSGLPEEADVDDGVVVAQQLLWTEARDRSKWSDSTSRHARLERQQALVDLQGRLRHGGVCGHLGLAAQSAWQAAHTARKRADMVYALSEARRHMLKAASLLNEVNVEAAGAILLHVELPLWTFLRDHEYGRDAVARSWKLLGEILGPSPVVLEAGAATGDDTEKMCLAWRRARFHAVEPFPANYKLLRQRLAGLPRCEGRVQTHNAALSSRSGWAAMYPVEHDGSFTANSLFPLSNKARRQSSHWNASFSKMTVATSTLDDLAKAAAISRVDFLRLDMEGAEMDALLSGPRVLRGVRLLQVEVRPDYTWRRGRQSGQGDKAGTEASAASGAQPEETTTSLEAYVRWLRPRGWRLLWNSVGAERPDGSGDALFLRANDAGGVMGVPPTLTSLQ
eukprot:TRINITY_DN922_c0_g5_i1.p1 TRINITY_DN922_c0_g5~~TRINITY_DN922_c0_g5_i1.p1  ORF type:complete len:512 (-),score=105.06 TRINITY_DN922_c0_g5_i1:47-1582(-)